MAFVSHISVFGRLHFTLVSSVTDKKPLPVAVTPVRTNRCHMVCSSAPQDMKFTYFDIRVRDILIVAHVLKYSSTEPANLTKKKERLWLF